MKRLNNQQEAADDIVSASAGSYVVRLPFESDAVMYTTLTSLASHLWWVSQLMVRMRAWI
jgi:hypothetical protein